MLSKGEKLPVKLPITSSKLLKTLDISLKQVDKKKGSDCVGVTFPSKPSVKLQTQPYGTPKSPLSELSEDSSLRLREFNGQGTAIHSLLRAVLISAFRMKGPPSRTLRLSRSVLLHCWLAVVVGGGGSELESGNVVVV